MTENVHFQYSVLTNLLIFNHSALLRMGTSFSQTELHLKSAVEPSAPSFPTFSFLLPKRLQFPQTLLTGIDLPHK